MARVNLRSKVLWRDVLAEFVGTFMLMSVQCALPLTWADSASGNPLAMSVNTCLGMGFIVCTMAWMCADFGGGHFNPAVTVAMTVVMKISPIKGLLFIVSQCLAALSGAAFIYSVTPEARREGLAATSLGPGVEAWQGLLIEIWITSILVLTIFGATNARRKENLFMPTIPIGFAVSVGVLTGFASTGGSMNPARSLGPAVVMSIWDDHWIYWVGPILGGLLASLVYTGLDVISRDSELDDSEAGKINLAMTADTPVYDQHL